MTLAMPDSVRVADMPPGYPAYLGYVDGQWPTAADLVRRFPGKRYVLLTVTGATLAASGCDIEAGDLTPDGGAWWARRKLDRDSGSRPVLYASVGVMGQVRDRLVVHQVPRSSVRLLSAHWGWKSTDHTDPANRHICGPGTCGAVSIGMDGTQWTDKFWTGAAMVDMSVLQDGFFGQSWTEEIVGQLPVVRQGDSGQAVRTVQGLCAARNVGPDGLAIDGIFGPQTREAVVTAQQRAHVTADGIVGPVTWPVLLGIA